MSPGSIQWFAVLAAAVVSFLLGGLWYGPLFGKRWQREVGLSDDALRQGQGRIFGASFVFALMSATNLAAFLGPDATIGFGVGAGAAAGLGWVATSLGTTYLFERRSLALGLIDAGYHVVTFAVMGTILGAWH